MQMGRHDAPFHLAYDDDHGPLSGCEFVYRQPVTPEQTRDLLEGCFFGHGGFAMDGDEHWTAELVRDWWRERGRLRAWATETSGRWARQGGTYRAHSARCRHRPDPRIFAGCSSDVKTPDNAAPKGNPGTHVKVSCKIAQAM
ncbi:hypothetical protein ACFQ6N_35070 [Kitasatospora sp. NPDC056446]|uniref:hypothetical protein n=1 Tax=Kitasatospora sp. NPDC056446 TaxID=3345819 RepID=UPI00368E7634